MGARVVVVGGANWDRSWVLPHLPAPGETVLGAHGAEGPGGKAFNVAVGVARLGESVALVARLRDDAAGVRLRDWLAGEGVDAAGLVVAAAEPTGSAAIWLAGGENAIAVAGGANAGLDAPATAAALDRCGEGCDLLVLQAEAPDAALEAAAQWAARRRAASVPGRGRLPSPRVLLSPAPARVLPAAVWAAADVCVCNRIEAQTLSGVVVNDPLDAEDAALALLSLGCSTAVVTLGADGAVVARGSRATYLPPFTVAVVDPTGAGDAAAAALARGTVAGLDIFAATGYAMAAAAICVGRHGAAGSMATLDEVDRMVHSVDLRRDAGNEPVRLLDLS